MYFIINKEKKKKKKAILDFSLGNVRELLLYFSLVKYQYKITEYNNLNVKFSNSQLNKLKSGIKNGTEAALNLSLNVIREFNDDTYRHDSLSFCK